MMRIIVGISVLCVLLQGCNLDPNALMGAQGRNSARSVSQDSSNNVTPVSSSEGVLSGGFCRDRSHERSGEVYLKTGASRIKNWMTVSVDVGLRQIDLIRPVREEHPFTTVTRVTYVSQSRPRDYLRFECAGQYYSEDWVPHYGRCILDRREVYDEKGKLLETTPYSPSKNWPQLALAPEASAENADWYVPFEIVFVTQTSSYSGELNETLSLPSTLDCDERTDQLPAELSLPELGLK